MTTVEVRTVVHVAREPLGRAIVALLASNCVLAVFGGEVGRACERFSLGVLREIELAGSYQSYNWRAATAIAVVIAASWLGSWMALHSINPELIVRARSHRIDA